MLKDGKDLPDELKEKLMEAERKASRASEPDPKTSTPHKNNDRGDMGEDKKQMAEKVTGDNAVDKTVEIVLTLQSLTNIIWLFSVCLSVSPPLPLLPPPPPPPPSLPVSLSVSVCLSVSLFLSQCMLIIFLMF